MAWKTNDKNTDKTEKKSVYEIITDRVIQLIESGQLNWKKTWALQEPMNYVSGKKYNGINHILLSCMGFSSPYWLTYKQATDMGGNIKKGSKGVPVVYFARKESKDKKVLKNGTEKAQFYVILRYYTVFNTEQCENIPEKSYNAPIIRDHSEIETLISAHNPELSRGNPAYSPGMDIIYMPDIKEFSSQNNYYKTFFHEMSHWTGHKDRLNRDEVTRKSGRFGDEDYSKEELVAELSAAFISSIYNISSDDTEANTAAYIQSWIKVLKNDPKMIISASSRAQKATEFLLKPVSNNIEVSEVSEKTEDGVYA
ncbi:MAG: zincin-like metallopeptidase domain-containing protein [Dehalococcoidales bacterium]|jgi:antirestriction protein ArdC